MTLFYLTLIILGAAVGGVVIWCGVCFLMGVLGGWRRLARTYVALARPTGRRYRFLSGRIGWFRYSNCLEAWLAPEGLYLGVHLVFRCGHPWLLIPWSHLHNLRAATSLFRHRLSVDVGAPKRATVHLPKAAFDEAPQVGAAP